MALAQLDAALGQMLAAITESPAIERVALKDMCNRVLAKDVYAELNVPQMHNSAMDGYALRVEEWQCSKAMQVSQRIVAGKAPEPLSPGTVARIFTGAPIPEGANAVVMQENTSLTDDGVVFDKLPQRGENIRLAGHDISAGECVLTKGLRLRAQDVGLIASMGMASADVYCQPRVAILSTGNELAEPGDILQAGQIYNANSYTLRALLSSWGCVVNDYGVLPDSYADVRAALEHAASESDFVMTTGGVSVGEEDHVKDAVNSIGSIDVWRIALKPGKPVVFGQVAGTPFLGLPGNPSSTFVTALLVARPLLLKLSGNKGDQPLYLSAAADFEVLSPGSREEYLRVKLTQDGSLCRAAAYANQSSGALRAASWGNALARIPIGKTLHRGEMVEVLLFESVL